MTSHHALPAFLKRYFWDVELVRVAALPLPVQTYLAGGTAATLRLGHRRSDDQAESETMPVMLIPFRWEQLKTFFEREVDRLMKSV